MRSGLPSLHFELGILHLPSRSTLYPFPHPFCGLGGWPLQTASVGFLALLILEGFGQWEHWQDIWRQKESECWVFISPTLSLLGYWLAVAVWRLQPVSILQLQLSLFLSFSLSGFSQGQRGDNESPLLLAPGCFIIPWWISFIKPCSVLLFEYAFCFLTQTLTETQL